MHTSLAAIVLGEAELHTAALGKLTTQHISCAPQGVYSQGLHCFDAMMNLSAGYQSLLLT